MTDIDIQARLARILRRPRTPSASEPSTSGPSPADVDSTDPRTLLIARERRVETRKAAPPADLRAEPGTSVLARRISLSAEHRHGEWRLAEALDADPRGLCLLGRDPELSAVDLGRALYLDTETSGLSGGAGTWVFLVGLGRFTCGEAGEVRFEIWQGFLAEPACERALLQDVAERIRASTAVVSFFGKSFDRHRLEDKMRIHGIDPPFANRPHLDLYHPLRRLYRARQGGGLEDARLKTVERELCGVEREDDLPGSRAPAAWFDFLHGRTHELEGVFRHNRDDVLSLVTLAGHLARTLEETRADGSPLSGPAVSRARAVAKTFVLAREYEAALVWFERALERGKADRSRSLRLEFAQALRRAGVCERALALLVELLAEPEDSLTAACRRESRRVDNAIRRPC